MMGRAEIDNDNEVSCGYSGSFGFAGDRFNCGLLVVVNRAQIF